MKGEFAPLSHLTLQPGTSYLRPPELPDRVYVNSPAIDVMTDFQYVRPRVTRPNVPIDAALEYMKTSGVRLLLVTDETDHVAGIVTSYDIQGERPIKLVQDSRVARSQITVDQVMAHHAEVPVVSMLSVRNAQVGHIVETLRVIERRHLLVLDAEEEGGGDETSSPLAARAWSDPAQSLPRMRAGDHPVRGLFSAAQISRQLRVDVGQVMTAAHSLAEIRHGIA